MWDDLVPGFHAWFDKNRSKLFKDCLIVSTRQALGTEGGITTNGLELKHKLQKKKIKEEDIPKEVSAVTKVLNAWVNEYHIEEERALRGLGKFRLASGYERFLVDPVRWNRWGPERQKQPSRHSEHSHLYLLINVRSQPQLASSAPQPTRGDELFSQNHSFSLTKQNPLHHSFPVTKLNHLQRKSPH